MPLLRALLVVALAQRGEREEAAALFEELRLLPDQLATGVRWAGTVGQIGMAAVALGDAEVADRVYELLRDVGGPYGGDGSGFIVAAGSTALTERRLRPRCGTDRGRGGALCGRRDRQRKDRCPAVRGAVPAGLGDRAARPLAGPHPAVLGLRSRGRDVAGPPGGRRVAPTGHAGPAAAGRPAARRPRRGGPIGQSAHRAGERGGGAGGEGTAEQGDRRRRWSCRSGPSSRMCATSWSSSTWAAARRSPAGWWPAAATRRIRADVAHSPFRGTAGGWGRL